MVGVGTPTGVVALNESRYGWLLSWAARFGVLLLRSSIHLSRMDRRPSSLQQRRVRRSSCGSNRHLRANRQHVQSCAACGRARVCACHMLHVKALVALLRDMVAYLADVCALCFRLLAATPSRRLSAIVCGTKKES